MKVTMKDIAREAGVSIATVSHVVNGTKRISDEKYQLIMQTIEKYNYIPDSRAKNLRLQQTKTAGLVVSSFPDAYVTGFVNGVGKRARELGYHLLFVNTSENLEYEQETVQLLSSRMVDGIILSPTSSNIDYLRDYIEQIPIVLVNRYDPRLTDLPRVTADDFQAGYDATRHLIQHGHQHIGLIYAIPDVTTTVQRIEGYKTALQEAGLPFEEQYMKIGHATVDGGMSATKTLLARKKQITALFVLSDLMTIGAVKGIKSSSRKCPEDIALVGFGDFEASSIIDPPVSNVSLPPEVIGTTAFDALLNKMNNPAYCKHIQLPTSLSLRKSCGC